MCRIYSPAHMWIYMNMCVCICIDTHIYTHLMFFSYMPGNLEEIQIFKGWMGEPKRS